jgi:hypothetical protein
MATINLGAIKFNWTGAYNSSTSYAVDDVVSSGGNSYVCIQAHSNQAVGNATAYWNIMSSAGTNGSNGTDVGTVITTQGDLLYRDGSGLQRLAKGTANQTLQMNGAANAPTWVTAESGTLVKIATLEHSSNVSAVNFTNCFTADYDVYEVYFSNIHSDSNSYELAVGLVDASGNQLVHNYMTATYSYIAYAGNSSGHNAFGQDDDSRIRLIGENLDNGAFDPSQLKMTIYNPYASIHTTTQYWYSIRAANNHYYNVLGTAQNKNQTSVRSLKFYQNGGGNFAGYTGTVYGVKR